MEKNNFIHKINDLWKDYCENHCGDINSFQKRAIESFVEKNRDYFKNNPPKDKSVFFDPEMELAVEQEFLEHIFKVYKTESFVAYISDMIRTKQK
jgi:hypothetical protein